MKTIYISGPITDLATGLPRKDWQKDFLDAEERLRQMGFRPVSPVDIAKETEEEWRQLWTLPGDMARWNGPVADAIARRPTRGTYITSCLQAMNTEALASRLHGVYVIGPHRGPDVIRRILRSDGVMMELHMARVLGIPAFAQFYGDREIDIRLLPVKHGRRLLGNGEFGKQE